MKKIGILLTLFLIFGIVGALNVMATTVTLIKPADSAVIAGPGTKAGGYNVTATLGTSDITLGNEILNMTFFIKEVASSSYQYIGYLQNSSENQTSWWMNTSAGAAGLDLLNVSKFRDETVTFKVDAYNTSGRLASSDTSTGVVFNTTAATATYDSTFPATGTTLTTSKLFSITSGAGTYTAGLEELKSATLYLNTIAYTMTATDTNKTAWSVTLDKSNVADGIYSTTVTIADTDSARTYNIGARELTFKLRDRSSIMPVLVSEEVVKTQDSGKDKNTIVWLIGAIIAGIVAVKIFSKR